MDLSSGYSQENSFSWACLLLLGIYQEIVRPPSETDTLVAGAAVSKCLTTRSGVTMLGDLMTSELCRLPSEPMLSRKCQHWGFVLSHARGRDQRLLSDRST